MDVDPQTFSQRLANLERLLFAVVRAVSEEIEERYGLQGAIKPISRKKFALVNERYWQLVSEFKSINVFPSVSRINCPKKAALTIYVAATNKDPLFTARTEAPLSHADYALLHFSLSVMEMFMGIDVDKIDNRHRRDLNACLFHLQEDAAGDNRMRLHLLCLYMDTFWMRGSRAGGDRSDD